MILTIPLHGLGDILYHSLTLKLIHKKTNDDIILFCPKSSSFIPDFFDVPYMPQYSKLLKNDLTLSFKEEIAFWQELRNFSNARMFTILCDRVDSFIANRYQFHILENGLSNYYLINNQGLRGKLNYRYSPKGINPKHFLLRMYLNVSALIPITKNEFAVQIRQIFNEQILFRGIEKENEKKNKKIGIFPDAGSPTRSMTKNQIEFIISYYRRDNYIFDIYTSRVFVDFHNDNVTVKRFSSFKDIIRDCNLYDIVFTCDSFPAHFSGLLGKKTFVIYNCPQIKKYCEYWGTPYSNVIHVEGKSIYTLNEYFDANVVNPSTNEDYMLLDLINKK